MLIILPKPAKITEYHTLAINLENYDEISISKNNETNLFTLSIIRQFDAHNSNHSAFFFMLGTFESADDCLELFQNIVDALNDGQKTFKIPQVPLPIEPASSDQPGQRSPYN